MRKRPSLLHKDATQDVNAVFKLSRRKGSSLWQVRKRWPQDVAGILRGEFTRSTGEADKKRAQERLPLIAAEYESQVKAARDRLADNTLRDLSEPEMNRLAAAFYRDALPTYRIGNALSPVSHDTMLRDTRARIESLTKMQSRKEFAPVAAIAHGMIQREGLPVPEDTLVVTRLDRLARSVIDLHQLVERITAKGAGLRVLQQAGIDTTTSTGKLTLAILAAVAEFEADIRKERQRDGIEKAKEKGIYKGRPPKLPVDKVRELHAAGMKPAHIARELMIGRTSVYRALADHADGG